VVQRHASKRFGTPAPPKPEQIVAAMRRTIQRVRKMSHHERVQSLKDAGVLTPTGKLAARYR
jgi:hypothetical protein